MSRISTHVIEATVESAREMLDLGMGIEQDREYIQDAESLRCQLGSEAWDNGVELEEDRENGTYEFDDTTWKVV